EKTLKNENYSVDYNGFNKYFVDKIKNKKSNELEFAPNVFYALKYYNKALNKYANELNFINQFHAIRIYFEDIFVFVINKISIKIKTWVN
ncbi:hypothetical protein, partial [Mycoplasmopsis bovis]|uniref:hypothetical protein n=1 Tax=Mycoplasmopsis bovis TaxID=28903 RepID=UPI003D2DE0F3